MNNNFQPTRLYIKECAGVKYFGKSTKEDIESYVGSGVVWLKRVKKYGKYNVKTLWVSDWYNDQHEIQSVALKFKKCESFEAVFGKNGWSTILKFAVICSATFMIVSTRSGSVLINFHGS